MGFDQSERAQGPIYVIIIIIIKFPYNARSDWLK